MRLRAYECFWYRSCAQRRKIFPFFFSVAAAAYNRLVQEGRRVFVRSVQSRTLVTRASLFFCCSVHMVTRGC